MERSSLSPKELRRHEVLSRVERKELRLTDAAELMRVSYPQAKRLWKRYREEGAAGLRHRAAGRRSNRAAPQELRERVLRIVRDEYGGGTAECFGPTLAAEHLLSDHGIEVRAPTLRLWMLSEGLWERRRKRKPHRRRRERKAHFGELVQLDGSHHKWLDDRAPKACLMNMVDDATSRARLLFANEETTWAAATLLERWVRDHGVPHALYTDWGAVYLRHPTARERRLGLDAQTQFGRMCERLDIAIIGAGSPQAKGRVERANGTHQDRLIKKMRLRGIGDYAAANQFLAGEYEAQHERLFAVEPAAAEDYHRVLPPRLRLADVFHLQSERVATADMVVRYCNRYLQLLPTYRQQVFKGARVTVREWRDGRLEIWHGEERIRHEELDSKPPKKAVPDRPRRSSKPSSKHPWRKSFRS